MAQLTQWVHRYTLRDLLDDSMDLFKERVITLMLAGLLPYVLVVAYQAIMRTYYIPGNLIPEFNFDSPDALGKILLNLFSTLRFWVYILGLSTVATIAFLLSLLAQCRVAIYHALGEEVSYQRIFRLLFKPWWSFFAISIVYNLFSSVVASIGSVIGSILVVIGSIIGMATGDEAVAAILSIVSLSISVLVITIAVTVTGALFLPSLIPPAYEHEGPFSAIGKSMRFAMLNFKAYTSALLILLHIPLVILGLVGMISGLLYLPFAYYAPAAGGVLVETILMTTAPLAFTGMIACLSAVSYIDGRCRTEAFDLCLLANQYGFGEEIEQALKQQKPAQAVASGYPNYLNTPRAVAPSVELPTPSTASSPIAFPDYSAPPPPLEQTASPAAEEPSAPATPASPDSPKREDFDAG